MIIDFRRKKTVVQPLYIDGGCESLSDQTPGRSPGGGPVLEDQHHGNRQEGTAETLLPENTQEIPPQTGPACVLYRCAVQSILTDCICVVPQPQRGVRSKGSSTRRRRSSVAPSPPWRHCTALVALRRQSRSSRTHTTRVTSTSYGCAQAGASAPWLPGQTDSRSVSFPGPYVH
ncbi:hypothetical protein CgunFtcFv8_001331 [Champsocephalus gunnari]|uniref:Uncharacterized protein n=1 Tax=Champsocephalus gunnari TaxID=52237 RepID=A0AAN8DPD3_CHAGU|nr:hypothetical protein CgunFtcFv8_001331 [Champsocephalus gunnari]